MHDQIWRLQKKTTTSIFGFSFYLAVFSTQEKELHAQTLNYR